MRNLYLWAEKRVVHAVVPSRFHVKLSIQLRLRFLSPPKTQSRPSFYMCPFYIILHYYIFTYVIYYIFTPYTIFCIYLLGTLGTVKISIKGIRSYSGPEQYP